MTTFSYTRTHLIAALLIFSSPTQGEVTVAEELQEIRQELKALRVEVERLRKALETMRKTAKVSPLPQTSEVHVDFERALGSPRARVGIIEFSDYQCPYCRRFHTETFEALRHKYVDTGEVLYSYRDFPLDFHPEAKPAAIAANCAGEQGAYWPMQRRLFGNQRSLGAAHYRHFAQQMQLNVETYKTCLTDPDKVKRVNEDRNEGERLGVRGTPHFFIGRLESGILTDVRSISGAQPFAVFAQAIELLLKSAD